MARPGAIAGSIPSRSLSASRAPDRLAAYPNEKFTETQLTIDEELDTERAGAA